MLREAYVLLRNRRCVVLFIIICFTLIVSLLFENALITKARTSLLMRPFSLRSYTDDIEIPRDCYMHNCFDYALCDVLSGFSVYAYDVEHVSKMYDVGGLVNASIFHALSKSPYLTTDPKTACIFIVVIEEPSQRLHDVQSQLHSLQFWNGDGRNHILLSMVKTSNDIEPFAGVDTGKAIIVQTAFIETVFRDKFDITIPPNLGNERTSMWTELPPLLPIRRMYFLSFYGEFGTILQSHGKYKPRFDSKTNTLATTENYTIMQQGKEIISPHVYDTKMHSNSDTNTNKHQGNDTRPRLNVHIEAKPTRKSANEFIGSLPDIGKQIIEILLKFQTDTREKVYLNFTCSLSRVSLQPCEWCLCDNAKLRSNILKQSTFSVIVSSTHLSIASTIAFQTRLFESLKHGAVPIILGEIVALPYAEILDWSKAAIILPKARAKNLHAFLRTLSDSDILEMRKTGRLFSEKYFGTTSSIIETMFAVLRTRLRISPNPVKDVKSDIIQINNTSPNIQTDSRLSMVQKQNINAETLREMFNRPGDPFHLFPSTPFQSAVFSVAQGSGLGIVQHPLQNNTQSQTFTAVILTYKRPDMLIDVIARLKGCPYLSKVVVAWNDPVSPPRNFSWPDIGVPLLVLKMSKNSLNNRFLPFDVIDTEAVLSLDNDILVEHKDIAIGFRTWRENRDRIVGYPARSHVRDKKDKTWLYDTTNSCKISMILTGQAFLHKYYAYLYSYEMPQVIRDKVDELMNCEDIAMNFLVSHVSRQPPIKVTAKSSFITKGAALSKRQGHYRDRAKCINFFEKVYGYQPLLYTQYRADYLFNSGGVSAKAKPKCV